jgi:hypothetical protein
MKSDVEMESGGNEIVGKFLTVVLLDQPEDGMKGVGNA